MADLDGDSFRDLVTANVSSDHATVLFYLPEPSARLLFFTGVGLLALLGHRRSPGRAR